MGADKLVLLIDDDADFHEIIRMIVEPAGYRLEGVSTGPAGLEAARRLLPDLILLDIMLDSPSEGFHLAYEMKKDEALEKIPIVMISAIGQTMGMDYAKELGTDYVPAAAFLDKPLEAKSLLGAMAKALEAAGNQ